MTRGNVIHKAARGTVGSLIDDEKPAKSATKSNLTAVYQVNPCALVPMADAESIIGRPIEVPRLAPLGPTCVYQPRGSKNTITLAVEALDFSKLKTHMRKVVQVKIRGRNEYCGVYGRPMTFVPLSGRTVLNVTAPCSVGTLLAAEAMIRLAA